MRIGLSIETDCIKSVLVNAGNMITSSATIEGNFFEDCTILGRNIKRLLFDQNQSISQIFIGIDFSEYAFLRGQCFTRIGIIRLAGHYPDTLPPCFNWPDDLKSKIVVGFETVCGGFEFDGQPITRLKDSEIIEAANTLINKGAQIIVVCGVFAHLYNKQEIFVQKLLEAHFQLKVFCSHYFSVEGFIERENLTCLNAAISNSFQETTNIIKALFKQIDINAELYFTQDMNSVLSFQQAQDFPIKTLESVAINSIAGALKLTHYNNMLIVDLKDKTTRIGIVREGNIVKFDVSNNFLRQETIWPYTIDIGLDTKVLIKNNEPILSNDDDTTDETLKNALLICNTNLKTNSQLDTHLAYKAVEIAEKMILDLYEKNVSKDKSLALGYYKDIGKNQHKMQIVFIGNSADIFSSHDTFVVPNFGTYAAAYGAVIRGNICTICEIVKEKMTTEILEDYKNQIFDILKSRRGKNPRVTFLNIVPYRYIPGELSKITITAVSDFAGDEPETYCELKLPY